MNCHKCKTSWSINGKCQYCGTPMPVDELTAAHADNKALRKELAAKDARIAELEGKLEGKQVTQLERAAQEVACQHDMLKWDALGDFDREACTENARRILDAAFPSPRSRR